uniref:V-type proton ATPase subunit G n=1 Tax=Blastobotrys adeninivorans TaxID=409370 RepID=A0A060TCS1_BLAAD
MSAQNSSGIQTLLEAERKAHEIVQNSRQYRAQRLKAAKTDAAKEIEEYKKEKEAEFQKNEQKYSGSNQDAEKEADKQVSGQLDEVKKKAASAKDKVVKELIDAVMTPNPQLHINA